MSCDENCIRLIIEFSAGETIRIHPNSSIMNDECALGHGVLYRREVRCFRINCVHKYLPFSLQKRWPRRALVFKVRRKYFKILFNYRDDLFSVELVCFDFISRFNDKTQFRQFYPIDFQFRLCRIALHPIFLVAYSSYAIIRAADKFCRAQDKEIFRGAFCSKSYILYQVRTFP